MAYPLVPSRRMAWDTDGTVAMWQSINEVGASPISSLLPADMNELTLTQKQDLNDEDLTTRLDAVGSPFDRQIRIILLFPEDREIDGYYANVTAYDDAALYYSTNTTNGVDGTWTAFTAPVVSTSLDPDDYRENIKSEAINGVRGIRFASNENNAYGVRSLHIYGTISPGETPHKLVYLDPTDSDNEFTDAYDYGDIERDATDYEFTFKVKNDSGSKTATTIQLTAEDIDDGSDAWYTLSDDDITYTATLQITSLASGVSSGTLYCRRNTPVDELPGPYVARIKAVVTTWS